MSTETNVVTLDEVRPLARSLPQRLLGTRLPLPFLTILTTESALVNMRRGRFLEALLLRKLGRLPIERPAGAPRYVFRAEEFAHSGRYGWIHRGDFRELYRQDALLLGKLSVQVWIVRYLLDWIGRPQGFVRNADGTLG
jgi:hypothetical protein